MNPKTDLHSKYYTTDAKITLCDRNGNILLTGDKRAELLTQRLYDDKNRLLSNIASLKTLLMVKKSVNVQAHPGFKLRHTLRGYRNTVYMTAWSPDGKMLASTSGDRNIKVWNAETGELSKTLKFQSVDVLSWSPNSQMLVSSSGVNGVDVWNLDIGKHFKLIDRYHSYFSSVAWSPDAEIIASSSYNNKIYLWNVDTWEIYQEIEGIAIHPRKILWSPKEKLLAVVSELSLVLLHINNDEVTWIIEGEYGWNPKFVWSPDGESIVIGNSTNSRNFNLLILDAKTGQQTNSLEGQTAAISDISFSSDGRFLAASSQDDTMRIWRCDTWETVAVIKGLDCGSKISFHPSEPVLATLGERDRIIRIWDLDIETILNVSSVPESVRYRSAKVVLVGDTGVGKSGLGTVITGGEFKATKSTHGRHVWSLNSSFHEMKNGLWEIREILLWDLAGQAEFRLVHQLSLDQTVVALVLFDGSSPTDPFKGVTFWNKALQQTKGSKHLVKYLVAARTDVSSLNVTEERMKNFASELGFQATFRTSAETGLGVQELLKEVLNAIEWEKLPLTISESLFKQIKDFILAHKQQGYVLEIYANITKYFRQDHPEVDFTDEQFKAALGSAEAHDLVKILSFGDYVLLQPELIDNYASAMARAAREQPDGLGFLDEQAARQGEFNFGSLTRAKEEEEQIILQSVLELFIEKELAIVDEGRLIFPSQFNRELPEYPEVQGTTVSYKFEGALLNAYTTLVVRLYHSEAFDLESLWKNAALFLPYGLNNTKKRCGFILKEPEEGTGLLTVFFGLEVPDETKILFLKYVHEHLKRKVLNGKVIRERIYRCPKCQEEVLDRKVIKLALDKNRPTIPCQFCYPLTTEIRLTDLIEETFGKDDKFLAQVRQMDDQINNRLDNDSKDTILKGEFITVVGKAGQIPRLTPSDDWGIDGEIEFKNDNGEACGERIYVQLKSGESYLKTRKKDEVRTFYISKQRHIDYWQSQQYPVYLIIRDKDEKIYWMNITEYLTSRNDKNNRTIEFKGEEMTVQSIKNLRETRLAQIVTRAMF